jgi:hypothetical protein
MIARSNGIGTQWTENSVYASMANNLAKCMSKRKLKGSPTDF